ncbi:IS66 family insertion sequence element accessory protein TnpB [Lichenibacterium minor]|uniref:IS66 family insertion sequence element accessory protein TnpB n=1 Tax=Lichenibacterium minor TaxID=2316528 RepID=UPI0026CFF196
MIPLPSGTKVWLAMGHTDMRKGIGGLSLLVQEVLGRDPFCGHLFVFRGRRSDLIKIVWHDGQGGCSWMGMEACRRPSGSRRLADSPRGPSTSTSRPRGRSSPLCKQRDGAASSTLWMR